MDTALISGAAALAGSVIGGVTSFMTSWLTQKGQTRAQNATQEIVKREVLYGRFIDEASRSFVEALKTEKDDPASIVALHAMTNRMRLISSSPVISEAETVIKLIVDAYLAPNQTLREIHSHMEEHKVDPLMKFAEACRSELLLLGSMMLK
jgi:hypothetical protein